MVKLVLTGGPPSQNSSTPRATMLPCETEGMWNTLSAKPSNGYKL